MKYIQTKVSLLALLILTLFLSSCQDKTFQTYTANIPVYQSLEDWRNTDFEMGSVRSMERPGKIYIYGNYLFVNEFLAGVHIIDNSNPANPVNLGFLEVLANVDMAVKDNVLYLDSYFDLLAFDISNPANPVLKSRTEDVFTFSDYALFASYNMDFPQTYPQANKGIVIGWTVEEITEETGTYYPYQFDLLQANSFDPVAESSVNNIGGQGKAGSTARFALYQDYLYTISSWSLNVFEISSDPVRLENISISWTLETLFIAEGYMYMGTTTGMMIYDLSNPALPSYIGGLTHVESCDPVVVQGTIAYVTLRSGNRCNRGEDQLIVIDISDFYNPSLIAEYDLHNPRGLGVDGDALFICDGSAGLKIFDKTNSTDILNNQISHFPSITTNDVIPYNDILIMTSAEGIYQYDYSDLQNINQISFIPVQ